MSAITRPSSTNSPRSVCEHQLAHLLPQSIPTYCMRASFESDCVTKRHIVDTSEALIHEIPVAPSIPRAPRLSVTRDAAAPERHMRADRLQRRPEALRTPWHRPAHSS